MKYLSLLWSNLRRKKLRTLFTLLSVMVAFLLFGLLGAVKTAFTAGVDLAGANRLVTTHKVSLIQLLPESYGNRVRAVEGVAQVSHATWLGGYYQEARNAFAAFPIEVESYLEVYPEIVLPAEQRGGFLRNRTGVLVGDLLAERFGWTVGDRIPLRSSIWRKEDGSDTWDLTIEGILTDDNHRQVVLFHYDHFDESRSSGARGLVGWYVIQIEDPDRAPEIAEEIDALFANSPAETKTSTEKSFAQAFANQIGDIGAITTAVVTAVFFTMLLVTANTMAQSFRERTNELGVLKTLGYSNMLVMILVLSEAIFVTVIGGALGLGMAYLVVAGAGDAFRQFLPVFYIPRSYVFLSVVLIIGLGLLAGALPAVQALRLRIVDALRATA